MATPLVPARTNSWAVLGVLMLGNFMALLDITIVNIAIPTMLDGLHASFDQILWVLNAYSLVFAVLLITAGRLGDIWGPRNVFAAGLVIFTAGSAGSGLAQDATWLIICRSVQGLGAALMSPQGLPFITSLFPPEKRGGPFAAMGMLSGIAVLAGPTLGGLIVTHIGWRWIFFLNVPIGLLTLVGVFIIIPDLRVGRRHRLDLGGVVLLTIGLFGVIYGLIEGERYNWGAVWGAITIPEIIAGGGVVLLLFLLTQARRQGQEPLVPFAIFRDRNFTLMTGVMAILGFAMLGLFLPLTIYYQSVLGLSALAAGLTIAPQPLAMMFASPVAAGLSQRVSGKYLLLPGLILFAAGMAYIDWQAHTDSGRWSFLPGLIISGIGLGFTWIPVFSLATRDLKPELAGVASGLVSTIQELGGVVASAVIGALMQNQLATELHDQATQVASQLPAQVRGSFVGSFQQAAQSGLQVGSGQTGGRMQIPAGLPAHIVTQIEQLSATVFTRSFVDALHPTVAVPIVLVLVGAVITIAVRRDSTPQDHAHLPQAVSEPSAIA